MKTAQVKRERGGFTNTQRYLRGKRARRRLLVDVHYHQPGPTEPCPAPNRLSCRQMRWFGVREDYLSLHSQWMNDADMKRLRQVLRSSPKPASRARTIA